MGYSSRQKYIYIYSDKRFLQSTFYTNKKLRILYQIWIPVNSRNLKLMWVTGGGGGCTGQRP